MGDDVRHGPLRRGDKFLKYDIQGLVGKGGYAWVYRGHDPFLEHDVAIKVLHRPGGTTADMLRRGRAEAKLLYHLKHKYIVEVTDAGITDTGLLYIVMELLEGETLREILRTRGKQSLGEALPLFARIAEGVAAAHAAQAIHRDLKPENIFVLHDGTPKILDFGIAKVVDSAGFTTEKDVVHGTMLYVSPEQLDGMRATVRSDVYALGLTMYEMLLGRHPYLLRNASPTIHELALIQKVHVPPWLDELDPVIPRYVARVVDRAITKLPEQRFGSMEDLRVAIRECQARYNSKAPISVPALGVSGSARGVERHDTEPMPVPSFTSELTLVQPEEADAFVPRSRTDRLERPLLQSTAPPVTTRTAPVPGRQRERRRPTRRQSLRRVLVSGALAGTALGVIVSLVLIANGPRPSNGDPAGWPNHPGTIEPRAAPPITIASVSGVPTTIASARPSASAVAFATPPPAKVARGNAAASRAVAGPMPSSAQTPGTSGERPVPMPQHKTAKGPGRREKIAGPARTRADREVWIE